MHRAEETINILIKAYLINKLKHGSTCKCAVGQMIQSKGVEIPTAWYHFLKDKFSYPLTIIIAQHDLSLIPYSIDEVRMIEESFELHSSLSYYFDSDGFRGLCSVFSTLEKIDSDYFALRYPIKIDRDMVLVDA